jgi:hypothetical protein
MTAFAMQARLNLALARIVAPFNPEAAEDHQSTAYQFAHSLGMCGGNPSPLIADEPLLSKAFRDGQEEQALICQQTQAIPPVQWCGQWTAAWDALSETQPFVVQTPQGPCAGLTVAHLNGDAGELTWGAPHASLDLAIAAAIKLEDQWHAEQLAAIEGHTQH